MCKRPKIETAQPLSAPIAAPSSREANRDADLEARLRRARSGAAANVLTSARGLPVATKMGEVGQ